MGKSKRRTQHASRGRRLMSTPIEEENEPLLHNTATLPSPSEHRHVFFGQPHHYEESMEVCIVCQNASMCTILKDM